MAGWLHAVCNCCLERIPSCFGCAQQDPEVVCCFDEVNSRAELNIQLLRGAVIQEDSECSDGSSYCKKILAENTLEDGSVITEFGGFFTCFPELLNPGPGELLQWVSDPIEAEDCLRRSDRPGNPLIQLGHRFVITPTCDGHGLPDAVVKQGGHHVQNELLERDPIVGWRGRGFNYAFPVVNNAVSSAGDCVRSNYFATEQISGECLQPGTRITADVQIRSNFCCYDADLLPSAQCVPTPSQTHDTEDTLCPAEI